MEKLDTHARTRDAAVAAHCTSAERKPAKARGQSAVELALLLPVLVTLLSIIIEGGLALNGWIRVSTAARDATRFAMDAGRRDDIATLVQNKLAGIDFGSSQAMTNSAQLDVYIVKGTTNSTGNISNWTPDHVYGSGSSTPTVQRAAIETSLASQGGTANRNISFTIVEVDYRYTPLLSTLLARGTKLPMSSYAIVQQY